MTGLLVILSLLMWFLNYWNFWPVLLIAILFVFITLTLSTNIKWNFFVKALNSNPGYPGNAVSITFDDGPSEYTLKILDVLEKYECKAVFFCIGKQIEKYPEIFQKVIQRGHIVGNHTFSHTRKMGFISSLRYQREIEACNNIAFERGNIEMKLFRPPFGIINPKTKIALKNTGHTVIGWNVRPYDAILNSPDLIFKRITRRLKNGDVILLHDNREQTIEILEQLLIFLKRQNYTTVRADNLFRINAYT